MGVPYQVYCDGHSSLSHDLRPIGVLGGSPRVLVVALFVVLVPADAETWLRSGSEPSASPSVWTVRMSSHDYAPNA